LYLVVKGDGIGEMSGSAPSVGILRRYKLAYQRVLQQRFGIQQGLQALCL